MANEPLRVGVIGCGRAACDLHLPALARVRDAEAIAIADPDRTALERAGDRFGVPRRSEDYRELLADEAIEAVCVAAPTHLHAEVGLAALDAGKHVFVEKPLALSLDECDLLVERATESGLTTMVGFNLRWHHHVRGARELIQRGELGELSLLSSAFMSPSLLREVPSWRADPARGGGLLALQAVHHLDLWRYLLGQEIDEVLCGASRETGSGAGPGAAAVTARSAGGVRIAGAFCAVTGQENEFAVYGSEAWLRASLYRFDGVELMPRESTGGDLGRQARRPGRFLSDLARAAPRLRRGGDFKSSYQAEWRQFVDAIRHERPTECGFEEGREVTRVLLAVLQSAEAGGAVRVEDAPRSVQDVSRLPSAAERSVDARNLAG